MKIEIKEITKENKAQIAKLHVKNAQKAYVETVAESLADAKEHSEYCPVGLYQGDNLIGFAMYGFFANEDKNGRVWLDRYFIDEHFQGQGLGGNALKALLKHLESKYHCTEIYLSLYENNQVALSLYENFGFSFTGELDINGEKVMVKKLKTSGR